MAGHTYGVRRFLSAGEVAELAELLEDEPLRTGLVDEVLQAAEEGRGMKLILIDSSSRAEEEQIG